MTKTASTFTNQKVRNQIRHDYEQKLYDYEEKSKSSTAENSKTAGEIQYCQSIELREKKLQKK